MRIDWLLTEDSVSVDNACETADEVDDWRLKLFVTDAVRDELAWRDVGFDSMLVVPWFGEDVVKLKDV